MILVDKKIEVIGLGSGEIDDLPLGIYRKLKNNNHLIYARTKKHPVIDELQKEGIFFHSFDYLYEEETDFQKVYERIVNELIDQAKTSTVIYAVPGHPMLAEQTVQMLLKQDDIPIHLIGGQSYLDALFTALKIDPIDGFQFVDGTNFSREHLNFRQHLIFCQVYDPFIASHIKLVLLEDLPANYTV